MTLQEQVIAPVNLRIVGIANLEPRRAPAKQSIRTLRQLGDNALAIALADRAEEIDAATDNMVSAELELPRSRGQVNAFALGLR